MPNSGDTKIVTVPMYQADIKKMRNSAKAAYEASDSFSGLVDLCKLFVQYVPEPFKIATAVLLEMVGYGGGKVGDYNYSLMWAYQDALDAMLGTTPVIYYDVKQKFVYVTHGATGAWIQKEIPTFVRHYTDY